MAVLVQINGVAGVSILIDKSAFRIGRGEDNDLRIDDELVSREHGLIEYNDAIRDARISGWIIRDKDSTNGTYVNDRRITSHSLVEGDVLRIGKTFFKFFADNNGAHGETRIVKKTIIPGVYYTTEKS